MELYDIGKLLGTGASGEVFVCKHKKQGKQYALKKIKMIDIESKDRQNIENELKLLQKLRHPNIVSFKDSFTDKHGNLCIVMVYCEMGDMHNKIKQTKEKGKSFPEAQILDWLAQTALAIHYLHTQQILHRDLKAQNLFLKEIKYKLDEETKKDERVKLGDFGISKVLDTTQDLAQTYIGTPLYMAPQLFKFKPYSYKSDIWSLGIILYEMCNLRPPFQAQHYNALAIKILKKSYPSVTPTYSKQLRDLIGSMLNKKPQQRPTIIDILNKPFVRPRVQKYMSEMFSRSKGQADSDDVYLDTLREQAIQLNFNLNEEEEAMNKYPSLKDLEKRMSRNNLIRREDDEAEPREYHSKRKSTFENSSYSLDKNIKKYEESSSSSYKALNLAYIKERDAFVDHKKSSMMEREEPRMAATHGKKPFEINNSNNNKESYNKETIRRFRIHQEYTMEDESNRIEEVAIEEEIIREDSDEDSNQLTMNLQQEDQEVPETYNKSYYKFLDQIRILKHICETAIGGNKFLRAYNAVNNGCNKATMLEILGPEMIGYWHLIDQIMFNESILKTLPKE